MPDPVSDPVGFARLLGREPFDHQLPPLRSAASIIAIYGGRRSGKTVAAEIGGPLFHTFTRRGVTAIVTGPNESNVKERMRELMALVRESSRMRGAVVDEAALTITLANGSRIVGLAPTSGNLRGRGKGVFCVWIDEAGFCAESLIRDARYLILDHLEEGAQLWLTGTPWGQGFFRQAVRNAEDGDPDFAAFGPWKADMNPRNPRGWIERERERLNALEAMAELDGEWSDEGERFFPPSLLERCTADVVLSRWADATDGARPVVTADFGVEYDQSASVQLFRVPGLSALNEGREWRPVFTPILKLWATGTRLLDVAEEIAGLRCSPSHYSLERSGLGEGPVELIRERVRRRLEGFSPGRTTRGEWEQVFTRWCLIRTTAATKLASYSLTRWLLERDQLVLPRDPILLRQMAGVRMEVSEHGTARLEAEDPRVHDDAADALSFCAMPISAERGVACGLRPLAGLGAVPDADVPELEQPTVETGAGLRVYERPPLQSVAGWDVTLPEGVRVVKPELPPSAVPSLRSVEVLIPSPGGMNGNHH